MKGKKINKQNKTELNRILKETFSLLDEIKKKFIDFESNTISIEKFKDSLYQKETVSANCLMIIVP